MKVITIGKKYKVTDYLKTELNLKTSVVTVVSLTGSTISISESGSIYNINYLLFSNHSSKPVISSRKTVVVPEVPVIEPTIIPEPVVPVEPEPIIEPEPIVEPEPVIVPEPEPVVVPEPDPYDDPYGDDPYGDYL